MDESAVEAFEAVSVHKKRKICATPFWQIAGDFNRGFKRTDREVFDGEIKRLWCDDEFVARDMVDVGRPNLAWSA